jgi:hypothetical protein
MSQYKQISITALALRLESQASFLMREEQKLKGGFNDLVLFWLESAEDGRWSWCRCRCGWLLQLEAVCWWNTADRLANVKNYIDMIMNWWHWWLAWINLMTAWLGRWVGFWRCWWPLLCPTGPYTLSETSSWQLEGITVCKKQKAKTTALRIPAWSPTVVLTKRYSG